MVFFCVTGLYDTGLCHSSRAQDARLSRAARQLKIILLTIIKPFYIGKIDVIVSAIYPNSSFSIY